MLTHVDQDGQPGMVDVGGKAVTRRTATATSTVLLPPEVARELHDEEIYSKKGPVFQTAIVAGTMAAKQTSTLIPFCHPLPMDSIKFSVTFESPERAVITCSVAARYVTGVEMEALTGASVAALTVYDMCKALSREMVISETRLLEKRGGKSDYSSPSQRNR